jgi:hypothetical protein
MSLSLIQLIVVSVVVGVLVWLMDAYMPMDAGIKKIVRVVTIVIIAVLWLVFLLRLVGLSI